MNAKFKNDTTATRQGDNYQYLVALECCLDAKEGDTIFIEQRGDVATDDTTIETKYHADENHKISDRHEDFWKTLKNLVENFQVISEYKSLVLLTTSQIQPSSRLINWNDLSKSDKLKILKEIISEKVTDTIKGFVNLIFTYTETYSEVILLNILDRFKISCSQLKIEPKIKILEGKECFKIIPSNNRRAYLLELLACIRDTGMTNPNDWRIDITEFNYLMQTKARSYISSTQPIPDRYKHIEVNQDDYKDYHFVNEIRAIQLEEEIPIAIKNYFKMQRTIIDLTENDPLLPNSLKYYKKDILLEELHYIKSDCKSNVVDNTNGAELTRHSQKCYNGAMRMPLKSIEGYDPNQDFFQRGAIHTIVDEHDFSWLIEVNAITNEH